jgi:ribosome biogenesis GTPase A
MWPNVENKNSGYRLATTGAIRDTAIKHDDVAYFAAEFLLLNYPDNLKDRFQFETLPTSEHELMQEIGRKRGCLRSGGQVDMDKTAKILLSELRAGTLGRISLETPAIMATELAELKIIREQKAAEKAARKEKWKRS